MIPSNFLSTGLTSKEEYWIKYWTQWYASIITSHFQRPYKVVQ
jgi:hypothetical protein